MRLLALLVSFVLVQGPFALPPTRDQFLTIFGGYVETLRGQAGIPGMAGAIVGDSSDLLWQQSFGLRDIAASDATKIDTPFHFDGLTQLITATLVQQCVDSGRLTLETPIGTFAPSSPDAAATVGQILTHTSGAPGSLTFNYSTTRLDALKFVIETCKGTTFRQAFSAMLQQLGMTNSVPGPDAAMPELVNADVATSAQLARYQQVFARMAVPYGINPQNAATRTDYGVKTLGAASGLISTVFDFAKFDLALRQGVLLRADTLAAAWRAPVNTDGQVLPHGRGWFVQNYNGELVVWQYGIGAAASSSLVITLPNRNVTLILLANSDGLAKPASLSNGDVTVSPFARVFLGLVVK